MTEKMPEVFEPRDFQDSSQLDDQPISIMITSLKGGVGKTKTTAELAKALYRQGKKVGVLDLDYSAPNLMVEFKCENILPTRGENYTVVPPLIKGIRVLSWGMLWPPDTSIAIEDRQIDDEDIDRAIDLIKAEKYEYALRYLQLLKENPGGTIHHCGLLLQPGQVNWMGSEYLVIDTPPEVGGIVRIVAESANLFGAILVGHPSKVSMADVRRTVDLLRKKHTPIIGLISNQGTHNGENRFDLSDDDIESFAKSEHIPFIAAVPHTKDLAPYFDDIAEFVLRSEPRELRADTLRGREWKPIYRTARTAADLVNFVSHARDVIGDRRSRSRR